VPQFLGPCPFFCSPFLAALPSLGLGIKFFRASSIPNEVPLLKRFPPPPVFEQSPVFFFFSFPINQFTFLPKGFYPLCLGVRALLSGEVPVLAGSTPLFLPSHFLPVSRSAWPLCGGTWIDDLPPDFFGDLTGLVEEVEAGAFFTTRDGLHAKLPLPNHICNMLKDGEGVRGAFP